MSPENLFFDYPEADLILRSRDLCDFRVLKPYIVHSSPVLAEKLLLSPNPQPDRKPGTSAIPSGSKVEGTAANTLCILQLPIEGAILFSLLTYIFPVPPVLPSTVEQIMELLSVAQLYKMDVVLTHIRNHIAQPEPPFIQGDTAFLIYSLAQKHGLRTEALRAARCTLSFPGLTIENLAKEKKLDTIPGAFLHELWKYHERIWPNLMSDLEGFKRSDALAILGDLSCKAVFNGLPHWLDSYICKVITGHFPTILNISDFYTELAEHIQFRSSTGGCASCSRLPRTKISELWAALAAVVHGSIAKVSATHVVASPKELIDSTG